MRSILRLLILFITVSGLLLACQKEITGDQFIPTQPSNQPNITATVEGRVTDESGKPVAGAEVRTTTLSVFTDINGEFKLQNVSLYDNASYVSVKKGGYFTGSRTFVSTQGEKHYIEVKLLKKALAGSVTSQLGGVVKHLSGAEVSLPSAGVVRKSDNADYSGQVGISVAWIDPTSADLTLEMPGNLRGIDANSAEVGLQSFGMLAVELIGQGGEALQIAPGKTAGLKFPLPASIASNAPATIPLWSFNETSGLWKQEGVATKSGNFYEAQVSHFSFWNCDARFPVVDFTATIKDNSGKSLQRALVRLTRSAANSYTTAWTDSSGVVKGKIPSNETLMLEILNTCNTVVYSQSIGPFTSAASLTISATINNPQAAIITGNAVTCAGAAITNGSVELIINQRLYRARINSGNFSVSVNTCTNNQQVTIVAIDSVSNQQGSANLTVNQGPNNAGTINACGLSTTQFIDFSVSGTPYSLTPADSLQCYRQGNTTIVQAFKMNSGNTNSTIGINFGFNGATTGSHTLNSLASYVPFPVIDSAMLQVTATINITEYGNIGEYVAGSYSAVLVGRNTGNTYPVQCSFRVRRRN